MGGNLFAILIALLYGHKNNSEQIAHLGLQTTQFSNFKLHNNCQTFY